jgi:hypothetical protein
MAGFLSRLGLLCDGFRIVGLSGRPEARSGLRMMPPFPPSPLKFRRAGFPQYGFKAGLSDKAFPARWFAVVLRALRRYRYSLLCFRVDALISTSVGADQAALHGPRSGPGYSVPVHHHLIGPIRPTRGAHLDFTVAWLIADAFAAHIRICLSDPRLVLSFH